MHQALDITLGDLAVKAENNNLIRQEQVAKDDLASQLYRSILHKIVSRSLQPGEKLSTTSVAQAYKVSVTPVREAFKRLAAEGLIEIRPRKESIVSIITADNIRHLYEIRTMIETRAATKPFRSETLAAMHTCVEEMAKFKPSRLYKDFDLYWQYTMYDRHFHELLVEESNNPRLLEIYKNLHTHALIASVLFGKQLHDRGTEQRSEHEAILRALSEGNGDCAAQAVRMHLDRTCSVLLERWPSEAELAAPACGPKGA